MSDKPEQIIDSLFAPIASLVDTIIPVIHTAMCQMLIDAKEQGRQQGLVEAIEVAKAQQTLFYGGIVSAQEGMRDRIVEFIGLWAKGELPGQQETKP